MRSAPAISFELRRSLLLISATLLIAALALVSVAICAASPWLKAALIIAIVAGVAPALHGLFKPRWNAISHDQSGWQLRNHQGESRAAELHHHARLGALIVLDFRVQERRWHCLIAPDAINADTRRRLLLTLASLRPATAPQGSEPF